jgi:PST family polysaccharide transporter
LGTQELTEIPAEPAVSMPTAPGDDPNSSLTGAAVRGVAWQGASYLLGKTLIFVTTVVLARLLVPDDFGVVALALVFVNYADVVNDLGISQALVFLPVSQRRSDTALTVSLAFGALLVGIGQLAAPLVARLFHNGDVTTLFRVLSITLLLGPIGQVPDALLRRKLDFKRRLRNDLGRAVTRGAVAITLAALGFGPWSIVIGELAGDLGYAIVAWSLVDYRPSRRFWRVTRDDLRSLLAFGGPAAGSVFFSNLIFNIDYLIVGARLGATALGFYSLAFRLPELAIINVFFVLSSVAFPMFSRARTDNVRLRRGYLTSVRLQSLYGTAAGVGLAVVAPMVVHVAFGAKWEHSIVPLEALALYAAFRSLGTGANDVYKGIGRPGLALWLSFARLGVLAPALFIATRWGINAVAWTQVAVAAGFAIGMQALAARVLEIPMRKLLAAMRPAAVAGLGTALGAGLVRALVPTGAGDAIRLVLAIAAGGGLGFVALRIADRAALRDLRDLIARRAT